MLEKNLKKGMFMAEIPGWSVRLRNRVRRRSSFSLRSTLDFRKVAARKRKTSKLFCKTLYRYLRNSRT